MKQEDYAEILINATLVSPNDYTDIYEFVLNQDLQAIECVRVESLAEGIVFPVDNFQKTLSRVLFELNHVRVNPRVDNQFIIQKLTHALEHIGVGVKHPPQPDLMAVCYRPLGEITDNVRFHFDLDGKLIFLSPISKPVLVHSFNKKIDPAQSQSKL
jgi:hypothetical protein